jgi:hypothetical protein
MADPKNPPSFHDAIADASQAIAGSIGAPDYDSKFAGMILDVFHKFISGGKQAQQPSPGSPATGGPPAPGGPPPPGAGAGSPPPGPPPGVSGPTGNAGGSPVNSQQMSNSGPGAPTMGGLSQGLSPSPDELRRVLSDVAGK